MNITTSGLFFHQNEILHHLIKGADRILACWYTACFLSHHLGWDTLWIFSSLLDVLKFFNFLHLPFIHLTNSFPFVYVLMHASSHHDYHDHHHFGTIVVVLCLTRDLFGALWKMLSTKLFQNSVVSNAYAYLLSPVYTCINHSSLHHNQYIFK